MASFDIVSQIDTQEVRNAVDQADREVTNRYDFKNTNSTIEFNEKELSITLESASTDRTAAFKQILEEKFIKRKISLKAVEFGEIADAAGGRARLDVSLKAGIPSDMAKKLNKHIKDLKIKGIQSQTQGEQLRVTGKKRDALQDVIAALKEGDFDLPLQFENFRS